MSEKRFELSEIYSNTIMDTENCVNNGSHCRMYDIEKVVDLLNEQQDTISQLQDLCGKSNYENAKLRKELSDCEKFRYTVFKRLNDEYIKECSIK